MTALHFPHMKTFLTKIFCQNQRYPNLYFIMRSISLVRHCFLWRHILHKYYSQCETETNIIWMRYDFKVLIQMLVQMFYFDSNTTLPLRCAALVFWGDTVCWQDVVWLTVPLDPNKISFQTLIKLIAWQRLDQWTLSYISMTLDSTFTKTILRCTTFTSVFLHH